MARKFYDVWWFDTAKERWLAVAWQLSASAARDSAAALREHGERSTLTYSKTNPPRKRPWWANPRGTKGDF